ncbi:MAG: ribonucleoside-diphosphate reductase subunit alpha [Candidatus Peregrinibacteria bacterium]
MTFTHIKKRNGEIVFFDRSRIEMALLKASESAKSPISQGEVKTVTDDILTKVSLKFVGQEAPDVETVQDAVEVSLLEHDFFEIAKRYILYRAEHAKMRAEKRLEELQKIENNKLKVTKQDGTSSLFSLKKGEENFKRASSGLEGVDLTALVNELKKNVFDGIPTKDISRALIMVAKSFIERDNAYSFVASRLLLGNTMREAFQQKIPADSEVFEETYKTVFIRNLKQAVEYGLLDGKLLEFNLERVADALEPDRDHLLTYLGMQTLYDRYFLHIEKRRVEVPQYFWMRVAMGLAINERDREAKAIEFYQALSTLRYISSTPTLFNAGTNHPQLSSCYLSTVKDDLTGIFKAYSDNAQLSKWAGGIGNDWTNIRATGSYIKGTNGTSQGVIPFLKINNDVAVAVNQGGKRKGAICAYLEIWHLDMEEFLDLRKNTGDERRRTHDMNTANWVPDLFMKRMRENKDWTLFSPNEVPDLHDLYGKAFEKRYEEYEHLANTGEIKKYKRMAAKDLWRKMVTMLFETGHPWITFKDPCNIRSPQDHVGVVHNSNLCTEITLNNSEDETAVCNLGSINLAQHITENGELDAVRLGETIRIAMRMLDNVVDINFYPTPETKNSNMRHRPVGLGIMGFQNLLYAKNMNFDSVEAVAFSDEMMEMVSYHAILSSSQLAQERGAYQSFPGSKWDRGIFPVDTIAILEEERGMETGVSKTGKMDWTPVREAVKKYGMRNSNCMAIAPTATISNIAGCIPCIEPIYKNLYVKSNMGGEFVVINTDLVHDLKKAGIWSAEMCRKLKAADGSIQRILDIPESIRAKYKEIFEIPTRYFVEHAATRGKWIDQSQSVNIFYRGTSGKEVSDVYEMAWEKGLKTTYYLRTLGATQVEKSTIGEKGSHKRENYNEEELSPVAKSIDAVMCSILNGPNCEACQ